MTLHKPIRPFNTKEAYPEQKLDNDLSQGVVARSSTVFLRGQVAHDLDTRISLYEGNSSKQTKKTMQNIALLLEEAGTTMEAVDCVAAENYCHHLTYRKQWPLGLT